MNRFTFSEEMAEIYKKKYPKGTRMDKTIKESISVDMSEVQNVETDFADSEPEGESVE